MNVTDIEETFAESEDNKLFRDAIAFGEQYRFEKPHAVQVCRLAMMIFDALEPLHRLAAAERRLLMVAALLHDVGMADGFPKHHKHSLRIIGDSRLPGMAEREMAMAANVARYHRKAEPSAGHAEYLKLADADRDKVDKLAAMLRLADVLDRDHGQRVRRLDITVSDAEVFIRAEGSEVALPDPAVLDKKSALFERVFGRHVRFVL